MAFVSRRALGKLIGLCHLLKKGVRREVILINRTMQTKQKRAYIPLSKVSIAVIKNANKKDVSRLGLKLIK